MLAVLGAALFSFNFGLSGLAGLEVAKAAPPPVSEDIYRWVQSSARTNYFFNRQQICFGVDENGMVDTNILIVPVLKTFDDVMINDVISKRRWNGRSLDGFGDFVGVAEYLRIDLTKQTVVLEELDYLDSTWSTITAEYNVAEVAVADLSDKSLEGNFYNRIIDFAMRNQVILAERTEGEIAPEKLEEMAAAQEAYRAEHEPDRPTDNEELPSDTSDTPDTPTSGGRLINVRY